MQNENLYIGDDKFNLFLKHYNCPTPLEVVKLKFAGAICSPNPNLRPTDVIASLFLENAQPRLETKSEAELFFKFFMGFWDEIFNNIKNNKLKLKKVKTINKSDLIDICIIRYNQIELGFVEGFWGGLDKLEIPQFAAELINSISQLAQIYTVLEKRLNQEENIDDIYEVIINTDKTVEKTINFLIENFVIPNIEKLQRTMN